MIDPRALLAARRHLQARHPSLPAETVNAFVEHPRRCAPTPGEYQRVTGLPPQLVNALWKTPGRRAA